MPQKNIDFGRFGARGIKGSDAVARKLDELAGGIATPVTAKRGWMARLHCLTKSTQTLKAWLEDRRRPSKTSLERIDQAYRTVRRHNVARHLLRRLNRDGRGTRVEIHPLNQSQVPQQLQRVVEYRTMNVRRWDRIVSSWAAGDHQSLDAAWQDTIVDLGSQWGQYEYVTNVGFAA